MKRIVKSLIIGVGIIGVSIGGLAVWQRDNVGAVADAVKYSKQEIAVSIEENKQLVEEIFAKYDMPVIKDFTLEEEEQIRKGERSVVTLPEKPASSRTETEEVNTKDVITYYTTEIYTLKAKYLGLLGELEKSAIATYKTLPEESRNLKGIQKIVTAYISEGLQLEAKCNAEVNNIISNFEVQLQALGADTAIVETMRVAYNNEKSLKKSYYLSLAKKGL